MKKALLAIEELFNDILTPRYNPMYNLGAIGIFFMWMLLVSGIYLFIFYRIGSPYESVRYMTEDQWYLGGIFRSIHRYASDGVIVVTVVHLTREFIKGRFRHWLWLPWVTGVATLFVIWGTGIIGYIMVWDQRAQMITDLTFKFLDNIPIFGESLSMAFSSASLVTNLFFLVILFLHLTFPVFLFLMLWIHLMRVAKPVINPVKGVAVAMTLAVVAMSIIKPATSLAPVEMNKVVSSIGIDWFYLFGYPLLNKVSVWATSIIFFILAAALFSIPWIFPTKRPQSAEIITEDCTGCGQCHEDCPYAAIFMKPREGGGEFDVFEAEVIPGRCASCGICVGACDYEAVNFPFKSRSSIYGEIKELVAGAKGESPQGPVIISVICSHIAGATGVVDPEKRSFRGVDGVRVVRLPCVGMANTAWLEYAISSGADGVFLWGCGSGNCHYRTGNTIMGERLSGERYPVLSASVDPSRVASYWSSATGGSGAVARLNEFRETLKAKSTEKRQKGE